MHEIPNTARRPAWLVLAATLLLASGCAVRSNQSNRLMLGPTQKINLATDVQAGTILPAANLSTFGVTTDSVTGASYAFACGTSLANTDNGHFKVFSNSGAIAITIFQAGPTGCAYAPNFVSGGISLTGAGTITITPSVSQISKNGGSYGSSITLSAGTSFKVLVDMVSSGCSTNGCWDVTQP